MRDLMDSMVRGTREVFQNPALAGALYVGAFVAVLVTKGVRRED